MKNQRCTHTHTDPEDTTLTTTVPLRVTTKQSSLSLQLSPMLPERFNHLFSALVSREISWPPCPCMVTLRTDIISSHSPGPCLSAIRSIPFFGLQNWEGVGGGGGKGVKRMMQEREKDKVTMRENEERRKERREKKRRDETRRQTRETRHKTVTLHHTLQRPRNNKTSGAKPATNTRRSHCGGRVKPAHPPRRTARTTLNSNACLVWTNKVSLQQGFVAGRTNLTRVF